MRFQFCAMRFQCYAMAYDVKDMLEPTVMGFENPKMSTEWM